MVPSGLPEPCMSHESFWVARTSYESCGVARPSYESCGGGWALLGPTRGRPSPGIVKIKTMRTLKMSRVSRLGAKDVSCEPFGVARPSYESFGGGWVRLGAMHSFLSENSPTAIRSELVGWPGAGRGHSAVSSLAGVGKEMIGQTLIKRKIAFGTRDRLE